MLQSHLRIAAVKHETLEATIITLALGWTGGSKVGVRGGVGEEIWLECKMKLKQRNWKSQGVIIWSCRLKPRESDTHAFAELTNQPGHNNRWVLEQLQSLSLKSGCHPGNSTSTCVRTHQRKHIKLLTNGLFSLLCFLTINYFPFS